MRGKRRNDNFDPVVRGGFLSDRPSKVGVEPRVSLPSLVDPEVACDPVRVRAAAVPDADACAEPAPNTDVAGPLRVYDVVVAAKCSVSAGVSSQGSDSPSTEPSIVDPQAKVPAAVGHDDLQFVCQKFDLVGPRAFLS